jgi:hypothetical protein
MWDWKEELVRWEDAVVEGEMNGQCTASLTQANYLKDVSMSAEAERWPRAFDRVCQGVCGMSSFTGLCR